MWIGLGILLIAMLIIALALRLPANYFWLPTLLAFLTGSYFAGVQFWNWMVAELSFYRVRTLIYLVLFVCLGQLVAYLLASLSRRKPNFGLLDIMDYTWIYFLVTAVPFYTKFYLTSMWPAFSGFWLVAIMLIIYVCMILIYLWAIPDQHIDTDENDGSQVHISAFNN